MIDVFLIQPPVSFSSKDLRDDIIPDCPPLGLMYLASSVTKDGFSVRILDAVDGSLTIQDILAFIEEERPKVIGITAMTMNIRGAIQLARSIRQNFKDNCKIGLGGPHISADPGLLRRFPYFDFGLVGEGEITFPDIVRKIIAERENFPNSGEIIEGQIPQDLDAIPFPARHLIDFNMYKKERGFWTNGIFTSRGCPYKCIFCGIPNINRKVRFRSPKLVVEEMIEAYKISGTKTFSFVDDTFNLRKRWVLELCEAIIASGLKPNWNAQARIDLIDDELLKKMKKAGCENLLFGVESGNERIRNDIINKGISDEQIYQATSLCWSNGIEPDFYLMLGFPTETKKEINDTVKFPLRVKPNIIGVHITMPLPGSKLFEQAIEEGIIESDTIDRFINGEFGDGYRGSWPYYVPNALTLEELMAARTRAYRKFYLRINYFIYRLIRDFRSRTRLKRDIVQALSLLRYGASANVKGS